MPPKTVGPIVSSVVGIDLGSQSCRVAELALNKRMPTVVRNNLSNESSPSILYYPANDATSTAATRGFGESVSAKPVNDLAHCVTDLKGWILATGDGSGERSFADAFKGEDLSLCASQVLSYTINSLLSFGNQSAAASRAAVAVSFPVSATSDVNEAPESIEAKVAARRQIISEAFAYALSKGVDKEGGMIGIVVDEAEAIAAYVHHLLFDSLPAGDTAESTPDVMAVVNIGHVFCTAVLIRVSKGACEVLASASLPSAGSGLIDDALATIVFDHIVQKNKVDIRNHQRSFQKVLRECQKAKEVLSSVDTTMVQLEGLSQDVDVSLKLTRDMVKNAAKDALIAPLVAMIASKIIPAVPEGVQVVRVEAVGGGWRTPCVQEAIVAAFPGAQRLGVSLDSNLCVAEGTSIVATKLLLASTTPAPKAEVEGEEEKAADDVTEVDAAERPGAFHDALALNIVNSSIVTSDAAAVPAWATSETALEEADKAYSSKMRIVDSCESFSFRVINLIGRCLGENAISSADQEAIRTILNPLDELVMDATDHSASTFEETLASAKSRIFGEEGVEEQSAPFPGLLAQERREAEEQAAKEKELEELSKQQEADKELKSDPQRLRMAQQRREQGAKLFKEEMWEEAQTRFVQALSAIGQLYDTTSPENKEKKDEISLSCHLNIASCAIKIGKWRIALNNAASALDIKPDHPKALFRRGQAQSALGEYQQAMIDLNKAKELTNGDGGVMAEIALLQQKMDKEKQREKKMFSKMFA